MIRPLEPRLLYHGSHPVGQRPHERRRGVGAAIECDWGMGEGWSHLAVVVNTSSAYDDISQHSVNRRESLWNLGWEEQRDPTIQARMRARIVHVRVA